MERQATLEGTLLRMERLRQNREQKEVCVGICVPSYLSKIEHGTVWANQEILDKLYERLGIFRELDEECLKESREKVREYFYRMEYRLDTESVYRELEERDQMLSYSPLAIDWLLIKGLDREVFPMREGALDCENAAGFATPLKLLGALKESMDGRQLAYYKLLLYWDEPKSPKRQSMCREACEVLGSSFAMNQLCFAYMQQGDYPAIHQMENRIVAAALEEGNTYQLAEYYFLKGSAYSCLNLEEMMMSYYKRSICLLQNTAWKSELRDLYYNVGASYISSGRYKEALENLDKAQELGGESIFIFHKKAIALIRGGQKEQASEFLEKMKKLLVSNPDSCETDYLRYEEACMECHENFLAAPEYLELLEKLMQALRTEYHFGHLYFYRDVIVEAYTRQRKYKKALEFEREISSKIVKNDI